MSARGEYEAGLDRIRALGVIVHDTAGRPTVGAPSLARAHATQPRLTEGALNQHARSMRAAFEALERQPQRPYRDDLTAVLSSLDFEWEDRGGFPSLRFEGSRAEQDMADALVEITAKLMKDEPRKWRAIQDRMHVEGQCVYWGLERWTEDCPADAA